MKNDETCRKMYKIVCQSSIDMISLTNKEIIIIIENGDDQKINKRQYPKLKPEQSFLKGIGIRGNEEENLIFIDSEIADEGGEAK